MFTQYSAIDSSGQNLCVAGRTGLAHYNMMSRKWKLFGNESQEKDFVVIGGLLWWQDYIVIGMIFIVYKSSLKILNPQHKDGFTCQKFSGNIIAYVLQDC